MRIVSSIKFGFSLVEILVVMALIGILSSIVYVNFGSAGATGRDAERQAELKKLQTAIEQYKVKYGQYPAQGCGSPENTFATELTCPDNYVVGLVPEFLPRLPRDPRRGTSEGFAYITNNSSNNVGTVYKAAVLQTVEGGVVTAEHPLRSCDMTVINRPADLTGDATRIMCGQVIFNSNNTPAYCQPSHQRFQTSYAVWGGYAEKTTSSNVFTANNSMLDLTQRVICR